MTNLQKAIEIIKNSNQLLQINIIDGENAYLYTKAEDDSYEIYCADRVECFKKEVMCDDVSEYTNERLRINFKIK